MGGKGVKTTELVRVDLFQQGVSLGEKMARNGVVLKMDVLDGGFTIILIVLDCTRIRVGQGMTRTHTSSIVREQLALPDAYIFSAFRLCAFLFIVLFLQQDTGRYYCRPIGEKRTRYGIVVKPL